MYNPGSESFDLKQLHLDFTLGKLTVDCASEGRDILQVDKIVKPELPKSTLEVIRQTKNEEQQKVVSVTTELAWYTLTVPEGAITRTSSAAVECAYTGPAVEGITWTLDDKVVRLH